MHTQTHMLLGAALLGRAPAPARTALSAAAGGLAPDIGASALVLWAAARGQDLQTIFAEDYFSALWQALLAPFHSVPLWLTAGVLALVLRRPALVAFAGSGLLHQAFDFPLHADDPHRHLWPLSDWRFESPISYWDPAHFGAWVQPLEIALGLGLLVVLWRRWAGRWARAALALTTILYVIQAVATAAFLWL